MAITVDCPFCASDLCRWQVPGRWNPRPSSAICSRGWPAVTIRQLWRSLADPGPQDAVGLLGLRSGLRCSWGLSGEHAGLDADELARRIQQHDTDFAYGGTAVGVRTPLYLDIQAVSERIRLEAATVHSCKAWGMMPEPGMVVSDRCAWSGT